jgi:acyl carrier protein
VTDTTDVKDTTGITPTTEQGRSEMTDISPGVIIDCVRKILNSDVTAETDIFSAGVDSLAVLRCRALLKEQTGVKVPGHVFFEGRTPARIADLIGAQNAGR